MAASTAQTVPQLVPIAGGWHVKDGDGFCIDIMQMAFGNLRVCISDPSHMTYGRAWCFHRPLHEVHLLALAFDPAKGEEPIGWVKEVLTERRACSGYYPHQTNDHQAYDPDCQFCGDETLSGNYR